MSRESTDAARVIITRNDLQARIKKPFDLNPSCTEGSELIHTFNIQNYTLQSLY